MYINLFMVEKYSLCRSFTTPMSIIGDHVELLILFIEFIYPRELEIKETTETAASSSYLDCYLYIDNEKLTTH